LSDGWSELDDSSAILLPGLAARAWTLEKGDATLEIEFIVSTIGDQGARDQLLEVATRTMMMEIPYGPGPSDLGDIAIATAEDEDSHSLAWAFHNVCVTVSREEGPDLLPLAREVHAFLRDQPIVTLAQRMPPIHDLEASSSRISIGESVEARILATEAMDESRFLVSFIDPDGFLKLKSDSGATAVLEGVTAGRAVLHGVVADQATLLSSFATAEIMVEAE